MFYQKILTKANKWIYPCILLDYIVAMEFNCLGLNITSSGNLLKGIKTQGQMQQKWQAV